MEYNACPKATLCRLVCASRLRCRGGSQTYRYYARGDFHLNSTDSLNASERPASSSDAASDTRAIDIDFRAAAGPLSPFYKNSVGAGRANEALRADWQRQLRYAKQRCDFQYLRMHGLLCDDMGVYFEDAGGRPVYSWQYIDEVHDFLDSIGVRPFVELGFMPSKLASGEQTIFWWKGNVCPPKDYGKWFDLIAALVTHWTERYGVDEVKTWYFEVWNEPNLHDFWPAGRDEYFKLYEVTAKAVKSVSPDYRVGGPGTAGNAWIEELIDYCVQNDVPLDFMSTHSYGVDVGFLDEFGGRGTVLSPRPEALSGDVKHVRKQIDSSERPGLPLFYTEWSASYTPSDPIHDSYVAAPYILDKLNDCIGHVDGMSYWTFTDIFEEAGPRTTPFHGGFGLMNYQDIEKPAFRAYQYLNMLGATRLACGDSRCIAATDGIDGVQALFWDLTINMPEGVNNQAYFNTDLKPGDKSVVAFQLRNLPRGRYRMSVYRVGYRINDPFADYLDMGSPSQLTRAQVARIKSNNDGAPVCMELVDIDNEAVLTRRFTVRENDVYLIDVKRL
jgi:xylan 1,4-beta-xylosidase